MQLRIPLPHILYGVFTALWVVRLALNEAHETDNLDDRTGQYLRKRTPQLFSNTIRYKKKH